MKFDIVKHRKWYFIISAIIAVVGIVIMSTMGLNLGTDFEAGSRVQFTVGHAFNTQDVQNDFSKQFPDLKVTQAQGIGNDGIVLRMDTKFTPDQEAAVKAYLDKTYTNSAPQISSVDPIVARELAQKAIYAILYASIGIILYMAVRFEYRFAISGVISVLQVVLVVVSLFALFRLEIDINFIAAVLTIVGYSIHDTIVIFDRIRDNLKHTKIKTTEDLEQMVNESIWATMARSLNTVLTVVLSAGALFLFGGSPIQHFALALLIGLVTGAYSSIFIASQLWVAWKSRELKKPKKASAQSQS
ncbi:protein translocase subunit SecF [Tumebacillus flagellatus]|uniref:Protein-export membrane protein SecF n=1 Tax=Tumebacillus flagellatus TaxID=1157490 RepID=A0A074LMA1_9BACL|nr:protein translocase subunit SecF [Tumebacillus flagellatus]KEO82239.1 preprotein translocase subunit SecF [Tumebacillus flagellatus]